LRKTIPIAAIAAAAICLALSTSCLAAPVLTNPLFMGVMSYDSGVEPGVNTFDLYNLTGGAISPDGIAYAEVFNGTLRPKRKPFLQSRTIVQP
jgi:hypothetical protein